jgi:hypothetical protein
VLSIHRMELSYLCDARREPTHVPRSLRDSPAYQPHWRFLVVERYLLEIAKAEDKSGHVEATLVREPDPYAAGPSSWSFETQDLIRGAHQWPLFGRQSFYRIGVNYSRKSTSYTRICYGRVNFPSEIAILGKSRKICRSRVTSGTRCSWAKATNSQS